MDASLLIPRGKSVTVLPQRGKHQRFQSSDVLVAFLQDGIPHLARCEVLQEKEKRGGGKQLESFPFGCSFFPGIPIFRDMIP